MLQLDDFFGEINSNYCGKLFDPVSEFFFKKKDVEEEVYRRYIQSGQYVELPVNNSLFRREIYEKFIDEYVTKHYKNDSALKRFLGYLNNSGEDHEHYETHFLYLCEQMNLEVESNKFFSNEFSELVKYWCISNNISYYE